MRAEVIAKLRKPRFLFMIGIVAVCVAVVILVFFGLGYLLGRVFL